MTVKLLTEHHLEFLSLIGGCTGSSESTLVKMPHCWNSHATAQISLCVWVKPVCKLHMCRAACTSVQSKLSMADRFAFIVQHNISLPLQWELNNAIKHGLPVAQSSVKRKNRHAHWSGTKACTCRLSLQYISPASWKNAYKKIECP